MRGQVRGNGRHSKGKRAVSDPALPQEERACLPTIIHVIDIHKDGVLELDLEFRFWSFLEAHPAHNALPHKAKVEALDVLTWAWTDRLLPSARPIPAPFSQEECQELMTLLRSFHDDHHHDDHGIQTRVVSRILLRVALWRQTYFRPNKPLPSDAGSVFNELPVRRRPFHRTLFDFVVSCLCLGIPYLFLERTRMSTRIDHESGVLRSNPMIIIGACTCLVAAIVLSASVTFLSLPGLDNVARTSGMVAVVFASFSLVSTAVAILRHKTDLGRPIPHVGIEGLMVISRRTVALSLPAVFLAYALIGFVTGIILYSFRGAPADPNGPKNSFEDYIRWIIVGVVGVLAGIVTTSLIVLRK
ncbi:hypothetical protein HYPSUDRAFT_146154 [Hypholoma sublateritium FD-334 SS-4]|uniref:Uncharacterized protein n=1 Tax=Hypholoma sublateritium (strain FD-334 SS-4) TaxID=945553 RepID=A0A0D2KSW7_HYPSF|nr:hypothetical protein HYPSUDRAFT_146154 [Hypholoma sublateritium FD-334 SS-4]